MPPSVGGASIAAVALEQVKHAYYILDHEFVFAFINAEAQRVLNMDRSSLLGRGLWDVFPDVVNTKLEDEFRRVAAERVPSSFEYYYSTWDRWYHLQADPIDAGLIVGFREITHEKLLQEELARSKDILALVSESGLIGSFRWLIPNDEVIISPEIHEMYELDRGLGKYDSALWYDLLHPDDREIVASRLTECFAQRASSVTYDFRTKQLDGHWRWLHCRAKFTYDEHGRPLLMVGVNVDITKQKRAEQELRSQRAQLEAIFQALQDGVAVFDTQGSLVFINEALAKITGFASAGELRQRFTDLPQIFELRTPEGALLPVAEWPRARSLRGETFAELELHAQRLDIQREWILSFSGGPILGPDGGQLLAVIVTRDITDAKRTARALHDIEERYRRLVESCPIGLVTGSIEGEKRGTLSFVNDAYLRIIGYNRDEFEAAGMRWDAITPPESMPADQAGIAEVIQQGVARPYEKEYIRKDGTRVPVLVAPAQMPGSDEVAAFVLDLTEIRQAKRALEERSFELARRVDEFETLLSVAPVGIAISRDPECRDIRVNQAFAGLLGVNPADNSSLTGPNAAQLPFRVYGGGRELAPDELPQQTAARTGEQTPNIELEIVRDDGTRYWVFGAAAPLFEENGSVRGTIGAYFDATELHMAAVKARESQARWERLMNSNIVGVFIGEGERIVEANELYLTMLGYSREDAAAATIDWVSVTPPEFVPRGNAARRELRERGVCQPFEKEYVRRDGTRIPVLIGFAALKWEPELTWIAFVVDLTAQKTLERELQAVNARLANSNQELERFAYVVAHDLQSPLRTITSMTTLLSRRLEPHLDAESKDLTNHIQSSVKRMARLISDLLDYARVTTQAVAPASAVDCSALFGWTVMNLQARIVETGALITADPLPRVQADDQLLRVFQNLIENAIKYRSDRPPEVHVSAERSGDEWVFSIRDNGIGFDIQHAERIFGVFHRLHGPGEYEGTGIGLAICRKVVERFGGRMWATSEKGIGSTFFFSLPAAPGAVDSHTPSN